MNAELQGESYLAPTPRIALRAPEAAAALGISERTLHTLTRAGKVPHARLAKAVLYSVDRLREWVNQGGELA